MADGRKSIPKPTMSGWYNPIRLVPTAIRVAISSVFGEFADRREAMGGARDTRACDSAYDYGKADEIWFDFVADTGDGWNPTYAIARLVSDPKLAVPGLPEQQGLARLLVLGGDQVYPTASREDYALRLQWPFDEAAQEWSSELKESDRPHVYAIPGNHDWYDGLSSFLGLFCGRVPGVKPGRIVGGRRTQQTRSYFALKLPQNWWLWGADVQLKGYIDQPQVDFFSRVAREWMDPGSQLIICTGCPEWAYIDPEAPQESFKNFAYLERLADLADKGHRVRLVLSGDSHHYARYEESIRQYITAGGGGAFLHPTHHLKDRLRAETPYPPPAPYKTQGRKRVERGREVTAYDREFTLARKQDSGERSVFPSFEQSKKLALGNLQFVRWNPGMAVALGGLNAIFTWLLDFTARAQGPSLPQKLGDGFLSAFCNYFTLILTAPWPALLLAAAVGAYGYLADFPKPGRWFIGAGHAAVQFAALVIVTVSGVLLGRCILGDHYSAFLIVYVGIVSGIVSSQILGLYFLGCLTCHGRHWNEAFSSLRIQDYKCFLRLHIDARGTLTVYPIGLARVPKDDGATPRNPPLDPQLIEPPIRLEKAA